MPTTIAAVPAAQAERNLFVAIDKRVLRLGLSPIAFHVYTLLRDHENDRHDQAEARRGSSNVGNRRLIADTGYSERKVKEAVAELLAAGLIERRRRYRGTSLTYSPRHPTNIDVDRLRAFQREQAERKAAKQAGGAQRRPTKRGAAAPDSAETVGRERAPSSGAPARPTELDPENETRVGSYRVGSYSLASLVNDPTRAAPTSGAHEIEAQAQRDAAFEVERCDIADGNQPPQDTCSDCGVTVDVGELFGGLCIDCWPGTRVAPEAGAHELDEVRARSDDPFEVERFDIAVSTRKRPTPTDRCSACEKEVDVGHLIDYLCDRCQPDDTRHGLANFYAAEMKRVHDATPIPRARVEVQHAAEALLARGYKPDDIRAGITLLVEQDAAPGNLIDISTGLAQRAA